MCPDVLSFVTSVCLMPDNFTCQGEEVLQFNGLTHLVAELPHLQVKSFDVRKVKKISKVYWGTLPVNELTRKSYNCISK